MTENQDQPAENIPGQDPVAKPVISPTTQSKDMEVHHHGHVHEQKKWKEYIFQFIMLFLAVFLGFLAENVREKGVEKNVEHEYIESLAVDLKNDYDLAARIEYSVFDQAMKIDTLQDLLFSDFNSQYRKDDIIRDCYKMSYNIKLFYSEFFNERTISQLLGSGTMRLIKKQGVADSVMEYHSRIKFMEVQKEMYIKSINELVQSMYSIYDIAFLKTIFDGEQFRYPNPDSMQCRLLTTDPAELRKFIAALETTKIVAFTYKNYLGEMKDRSERLYHFLVNKYDLKD